MNASLISGLDGPNSIAITSAATIPTFTWVNPAGGDWNDTNNWSPNKCRGTATTSSSPNAGTYTVTDSGSATLGNLTLGGASGTQTLNIASLTMNNASMVNSNGVLNWSGGDLEGSLTVAQGGTLSISNTVYFDERRSRYQHRLR